MNSENIIKLLVPFIGWVGVVCCTLGYLLLSMKVIRADSLPFQMFNIFGGLCLSVTALDTHDLPNAAANLLWMSIGLYAWSKQLIKREQKDSS